MIPRGIQLPTGIHMVGDALIVTVIYASCARSATHWDRIRKTRLTAAPANTWLFPFSHVPGDTQPLIEKQCDCCRCSVQLETPRTPKIKLAETQRAARQPRCQPDARRNRPQKGHVCMKVSCIDIQPAVGLDWAKRKP